MADGIQAINAFFFFFFFLFFRVFYLFACIINEVCVFNKRYCCIRITSITPAIRNCRVTPLSCPSVLFSIARAGGENVTRTPPECARDVFVEYPWVSMGEARGCARRIDRRRGPTSRLARAHPRVARRRRAHAPRVQRHAIDRRRSRHRPQRDRTGSVTQLVSKPGSRIRRPLLPQNAFAARASVRGK